MSLQSNLSLLTQRVANEAKALRTLINGNLSDLSTLSTTAKLSLVAAINELQSEIDSLASSGVVINDSTTSAGAVWSSSKVNTMLAALKSEIMGPGVSAALDTLKEIGDALAADDADIAGILVALGNRVRFDAAQSLTTPQQLQARQNIGAAGATDVGDTTTNFVAVFEAALV